MTRHRAIRPNVDLGPLTTYKLGGRAAWFADAGSESVLVEILESAHDLDLVVLDSTMPVMGGPECYRALREIDPEVRVLVSTATAFTESDLGSLYDGISAFIQKPYGLAQLTEAVTKAVQ